MKKNILRLLPFFLLGLLTFSCTKDKVTALTPVDSACTDTISFAHKIQPLINQNCSTSGCHDATTASSGYAFTSHAVISENAQIMLRAMRHESGVTPMPLSMPQLPDSLIQQFSCWVGQGKLNN